MRLRRCDAGFTLIELMIVVAILAILAVVAVPSFVKYMRRAKTVEAIENLEHIFRGSVLYFTTPRVIVDGPEVGQMAECMFPDAVPPTPAESCCGGEVDSDSDGRCDAAAASVWDNGFQNMSFSMLDHHYFVYSFASSGTGNSAVFTAEANGDLDCDGKYSTFRRSGLGRADGGVKGECSVRAAQAIMSKDETE